MAEEGTGTHQQEENEGEAAAAGVIERLATTDVPAWRFVAALVALVWIYRRRVLLPAALSGAVVLAISHLLR